PLGADHISGADRSGGTCTHTSYPAPGTAGIAAGDVTGDGRADLVSTSAGVQWASVRVFAQNAAGTLDGPVDYPGPVAETAEIADLDGDGRADVVLEDRNFMSGGEVMLQKPDGTLGQPTSVPMRDTAPANYSRSFRELAVADINGDSLPDALVTNEFELVAVYLNGTGVLPGNEQEWVRDVAPADFSTGLAQSVAPSVTFARALDPASVDASTVRLLRGTNGEPVDATAAYDPAARTVTLTPKSPLADNTPYRIAVGAVRDAIGTVNTTPFTTTFRTLNTAPPPITGFTATGSRDGTATLAWDPAPISDLDVQPVRMATGSTPPATPTSGTAVYNGTTSSVRTPVLAPGTTYTFRIWARDRTGLLSKPTDVVLRGSTLTMSGVPGSITAGSVVPVSVKAGGALAGAPVTLQSHGYNKPWGDVTTVTTDAQGLATAPQTPAAYTEYRWQYRGGPGAGAATSAVTSLGVRALVTGSAAPASVTAGSAVKVTGSVTPVKAGKPIQLQRLSGTSWVTVVAGTVPVSGTYLFTLRPATRGTVTYRVVIPADTDHLASTSPQIPLMVS
ncbi:MAG: serine protease, partial [Cryptosporangiaceae bacterium]|nr:serine protease [Cryptosporangiaceae bacterium]